MMMTDTIKHHPTKEILMAYSAGALPEAFNLLVAAHLSLCDACRAESECFDAIGGALLDETGPAPVEIDDGGLDATLALIAATPAAGSARAPRRGPSILPAPLRDYVGGDLEAVRWRSIGLGAKQAVLATSKAASARLLFIPAGSAMPDHGHRGTEMTLVLQGAFSDEQDSFRRGDVEIADEDLHHMPVADIGADCICLAVSDAPLKFRRLLPRLAQPFLGI